MRIDQPAIGVLILVMGVGAPSTFAQAYAGPGSLGGYGSSPSGAMLGSIGRSPMIIPYGGSFAGFMPDRMGGGSTLSFRTRPGAAMGAGRTTFSLSPLSGGMSGMSGGAFDGKAATSIGSRGTGLGDVMRRMPAGGGSGVMPPSIGYPFRQPPSLIAPSSGGIGMSM